MTDQPDRPGRPEREDDDVWAGIVAAYHASPDTAPSTPAAPESAPDAPPPDPAADALAAPEPGAWEEHRVGQSPTAAPGPRSWSAAEHVEEHYVPPPPAPAPPLEPADRAAWLGVIGGPVALLLIALVGWDAPDVVGWGLALGFLAGFVTLVVRMRSGREPDDGDGDDGAVV